MNHLHPAWLEIDLTSFQHNFSLIRNRIGRRKICCIVKANAYGHGLTPIALAAQKEGADYLGVACLREGVILRRAGVTIPILVLGAIHENQIEQFLQYELEFSISSLYKAKIVAKKAKALNQRCLVHVEIDTGIHRTGIRPESAPEIFDYLLEAGCFVIRGVYSHFANADHPEQGRNSVYEQIEQFFRLKNCFSFPDAIWHLANSGGICFYPDSYLDMVRCGLLLYGVAPYQGFDHLKQLLSLKARISYFKVVAEGRGISYGHLYRTSTQSRIVTVPVGYGDGLRRGLSNQGEVLIREKRYRIAGAICMDQLMVDIGSDEAYVGDEVVLIGSQGRDAIKLTELADLLNTDVREIMCHFTERLPREYHTEDVVLKEKIEACSKRTISFER